MNYEAQPREEGAGKNIEKIHAVDPLKEKEIKITNNIQLEIMEKHPDWIDDITKNGDTLRKHVQHNPDFFEKYEQDPEAVQKEIEELFYH